METPKNEDCDRTAESRPANGAGAGRYDSALRRRGVRKGREKGCWVYIPAVELEAAGIDPSAPAPWYRLYGHRRSKNAGAVIVSLYTEQ